MKVCLDVRYLVRSGSSSYITHIVPRVLALDPQTDYYLVKYREQNFPFEKDVKGVIVCGAKTNITRFLWVALVLPVRLAMAGIDVYHGMKFPGPGWGPKKIVNTVHSISSRYKGWFPRSLRARLFQIYLNPLFRRSDAIIAVSRFLSDFAIDAIKADPKRIHVIYHGVDDSFRLVDRAHVEKSKARHGITGRYFICVGNIFRVKNQITAVRAFAEIAKEFEGDLVIAGGTHDPYCDLLRAEAQKLGVADRVKLLGFVKGEVLTGLMNGAIADLLPSLTEGFGMAMLEAFRCGLPVIASNVGSLSELGEGCTLFVEDPADHRGFAEAMRKLLNSPELIEAVRLRSAARGSAFSWDTAAAEHVRVYHLVTAS